MVCRVPSPSLIARTFWAVVFVVAIGGGCGGGKAENKAKSDEALAKAREAAKLEEQGEEAAAVKQWGRTHPRRPPPPPPPPRAVAPAGSATASAGRGGKSVRPEEVARWRAEDFRAALRDHDPRLVEAVAYAGRHCATRESAELMAQLLEPPAGESGRQSPQRMAANPALVNAVVAALAANGTTTARRILAGLVTGTQATIDPQGAATAALKALLQDARRSDEELVFDIITSSCPDPPVNAEPAAIDRDKLRATALVWVKASASESLRLRLAKYTIAPATPSVISKQLLTLLSEARVENLAAQIVLYRSGRLSNRDEQSLARLFAEASRRELQRLLGRVSPAGPHLASSHQADGAAASCRAAELLWAPELDRWVEERLRAAAGAEGDWQLLPLACTVPRSSMRATVLQLLQQFWEEGPKRVQPFVVSEESLPEPGFLLLVKQLPRKARAAATGEGGGLSRSPAARTAKMAAARKAWERQDRTAEQWLAFSQMLAEALCRQLRAAALGRSARSGALPAFPSGFRRARVSRRRTTWNGLKRLPVLLVNFTCRPCALITPASSGGAGPIRSRRTFDTSCPRLFGTSAIRAYGLTISAWTGERGRCDPSTFSSAKRTRTSACCLTGSSS